MEATPSTVSTGSVDRVKEFVDFVSNSYVEIILVVLVIVVIYLNIKINDLNFKLHQTIINSPLRNDRPYDNRLERTYVYR